MPMFSAYGAGSVVGLAASFRNVVEDTMSAPLFSYFGTMQGQITVQGANGTGGGQPLVNGPAPASFANGVLVKTENVGSSGAKLLDQGLHYSPGPSARHRRGDGERRRFQCLSEEAAKFRPGRRQSSSTRCGLIQLGKEAPNCSVSAGGKVAPGRHTFQVAPVFSSGGEGLASPPSTACITTSGNQTITIKWMTVTGAVGYDLYESNRAISYRPPLVTGGNTDTIHMERWFSLRSRCPGIFWLRPDFGYCGRAEHPTAKTRKQFHRIARCRGFDCEPGLDVPDADGQVVLASAGQGFLPNHLLVTNSTGKLIDSGVQLMPVFDDMHHLDGTIQTANANWTGSAGTINIKGNAALGRGGEAFAVYTGVSWPSNDQTASIVLGSPGSPRSSTRVMVRGSASAQTGYLCSYSSTTTSLELSKAVGVRSPRSVRSPWQGFSATAMRSPSTSPVPRSLAT